MLKRLINRKFKASEVFSFLQMLKYIKLTPVDTMSWDFVSTLKRRRRTKGRNVLSSICMKKLHLRKTVWKRQNHIWEPVKHLWWSFFQEIANAWKLLIFFIFEWMLHISAFSYIATGHRNWQVVEKLCIKIRFTKQMI